MARLHNFLPFGFLELEAPELLPFFEILEQYWTVPDDAALVLSDEEGRGGNDDDDDDEVSVDMENGAAAAVEAESQPAIVNQPQQAGVPEMPPPSAVPRKAEVKDQVSSTWPLPPKSSDLPPPHTWTPEQRAEIQLRVAALKYLGFGNQCFALKIICFQTSFSQLWHSPTEWDLTLLASFGPFHPLPSTQATASGKSARVGEERGTDS